MAYLCCSDFESIYPSAQLKSFDPKLHTIACDVDFVPLLWLAMFRESDMQRQKIKVQGTASEGRAPIARKSQALTRLQDSVAILNALFSPEGPVDEYIRLLREALIAAPGKFVTIELDEVAQSLLGSESYFRGLTKALKYVDGANWGLKSAHSPTIKPMFQRTSGEVAKARNVLAKISGLRLYRPFPDARCKLQDHDISEDMEWNFTRLIGESFTRDVPWNPPLPEITEIAAAIARSSKRKKKKESPEEIDRRYAEYAAEFERNQPRYSGLELVGIISSWLYALLQTIAFVILPGYWKLGAGVPLLLASPGLWQLAVGIGRQLSGRSRAEQQKFEKWLDKPKGEFTTRLDDPILLYLAAPICCILLICILVAHRFIPR